MYFSKQRTQDIAFLIGAGLLFFLLRFPSLYEPYWYGDEGIYFVIGKALHAGRILYLDIWDNKPPLLYWLYFFFNDIFSIRFVSIIAGILAIISFFLLSTKFLNRKYLVYLSTVVFSLFLGLPSIEGNIANAENFMLFPVITAALLFWISIQKNDRHNDSSRFLFFSGFSVGIAFLLKTVAVFDFAALLVTLLILITLDSKKHHVSHFFRRSLPLIAGFFLPIIVTCIITGVQGALPIFLETLFLRNVSYVGEKNALFFPQGFLLIKLIFLLSGLYLIYLYRKSFREKTIFVLVWLGFSLFSTFFSQRPYTHYMLMMLPSLILVFGMTVDFGKTKQRPILAALGILSVVLLYNMFPHWNTKKTLAYYDNFLHFVSGKRTVHDYQRFFDRNTPRDYAVADYLSLHTKPNDSVFLWGNSAQIYYLSNTLPSGKYTVAYHIVTPEAVRETADKLRTDQPEFLIFLPGTEPFPILPPDYTYRVTIGDAHIYEKLF